MGESGNDSDLEPVVASTPAAIDSVSSATAAHDLDSDSPRGPGGAAALQNHLLPAAAEAHTV